MRKLERKWQIVLACSIGVIVAAVACCFWVGGPSVVLFRARFGTAPEVAATGFIRGLGTDVCWASLAALRDRPLDVNERCIRENSRPASQLRLVAVAAESGGATKLRYEFWDAKLSLRSELFVWVRKDKINWGVEGYARDY